MNNTSTIFTKNQSRKLSKTAAYIIDNKETIELLYRFDIISKYTKNMLLDISENVSTYSLKEDFVKALTLDSCTGSYAPVQSDDLPFKEQMLTMLTVQLLPTKTTNRSSFINDLETHKDFKNSIEFATLFAIHYGWEALLEILFSYTETIDDKNMTQRIINLIGMIAISIDIFNGRRSCINVFEKKYDYFKELPQVPHKFKNGEFVRGYQSAPYSKPVIIDSIPVIDTESGKGILLKLTRKGWEENHAYRSMIKIFKQVSMSNTFLISGSKIFDMLKEKSDLMNADNFKEILEKFVN